jgi:hypothetical protein
MLLILILVEIGITLNLDYNPMLLILILVEIGITGQLRLKMLENRI